MRVALGCALALLAVGPGAASPVRFLGAEDFPAESCIAQAQGVLVALGRFRLRIPFGDLKRVKALQDPAGDLGCATPLPVEDLLISTPDGFRGRLTYRAAKVSPEDAARILDTLRGFAARPSCEERESVRVCRIRANPLAPVTTFVFARDLGLALGSGAPAYLRCTSAGENETCKIQDLNPAGYQYEAAVRYSDDAAAIAALHRLATTKWERFARSAETAPVR